MNRSPLRGEGWQADLGMAAKVRPVLVVSAAPGANDYALIAVLPHTTSPRGSQYEITLSVPALRPGSFNLQGLLAVPLAKFLHPITTLKPDQMEQINAALKRWLALP